MKKSIVLLAVGVLLQSCTWVELTPGGEQVRVLSAAEVSGCREIGRTTSSLKSEIAGIPRKREKVRRELETLARNAAVDLDGDSVVPIGEPHDGKQTFAVYRCINP